MKNKVIILTAALLFVMSLSAHAQLGGILDRARQAVDAIESVTSGNQQQQQQQTQQPTLDKLSFQNTGAGNNITRMVGPLNTQISGEVVIPDTNNGLVVTTIGNVGFQNCTRITSVILPASMTFIGQNAFNGCTGLTSIIIPVNVDTIGTSAFAGCTNLTSVTFMGALPSSINTRSFPGDLTAKYRTGGAGVYTRQAGSDTWTRIGNAPVYTSPVNTSLDSVWERLDGTRITISGNSGTNTSFGNNLSALTQDAVNKGYYTIGGQAFRNIRSTGNLTWSAQYLGTNYNTRTPNVATGTQWIDVTITMNQNGRTFTFTASSFTDTFTRR